MIADYMPKDYNPYSCSHSVPGEDDEMSEGKRTVLIMGVLGFGFWGVLGFAIGGWETGMHLLAAVALIGCVAHSFGSLFRFLVSPGDEDAGSPSHLAQGGPNSVSITTTARNVDAS